MTKPNLITRTLSKDKPSVDDCLAIFTKTQDKLIAAVGRQDAIIVNCIAEIADAEAACAVVVAYNDDIIANAVAEQDRAQRIIANITLINQ